ncbi:MAG: PAS domain S-box protein [Beijerinckiaceae bacterium]|nr:PAS domain S-box protein [Beijerinckiaceae bacterium]
MATSQSRTRLRTGAEAWNGLAGWQLILLIAVAYFVTGRLGLALAIPPGYATVIWPPAGIAVSAAVLEGRRIWPGVLLGSFVVNLTVHFDTSSAHAVLMSLPVPAAVAAGAALQALAGGWMVKRYNAFPYAPATPAAIMRLFVFGGMIACLLNSTIAHAVLFALGRISASEVARSWLTWWGGDTIGVFVFAPLILGIACAPAGQKWRRGIPIAAATSAAFAVTVVLVATNIGAARRNLASEFSDLSQDFGTHIETTIALGTHAVGGLAGMFEGPQNRDLTEFRNVADRLAAFGLGIQAMEWIPKVTREERKSFEANYSSQWRRDFTIYERTDGKQMPAGDRPVYFPVTFVVPMRGNEGAVAFDVASNPTRNASLILAETSGQAVATPGLKLVQNDKMGILLFVPVFDDGLPARTAAERHEALKGFALGVFSVPDLLGIALQGRDTSDLQYWLADDTDPAAPSILVSNSAEAPADLRLPSSGWLAAVASVGERIPLQIGGRHWLFQMAPTPAYIAKHDDNAAYYLLTGGLLLTALVSGYVLVMTDRQYQLVASREKALEDQKFALDQHAIVSITDPRGIITYANDRFCEITGFARERLLGANHNIVDSGHHEPEFFEDLWATILDGKVWHGEICNRNSSGKSYWLDSTIVPLSDGKGRITQFISICTDVTASKRLEHDLESSRSFLESVTNSMGEGMYTLDANGLCTFLNAEAERLTGWKAEEMKDRPLHDLIHFQDQDGKHIHVDDCPIVQSVKLGGKYQSEDQYFTHRNGRVFPVSVIAVRLEEAGEFIGSVTVFQDITERSRIQDALKTSEQRLSIALNASNTGLWDLYPLTGQSVFSDTWFTMLGFAPGVLPSCGETFTTLMHPDDIAIYQAALTAHVGGQRPLMEVEFRMRRQDGGWAWIRSTGRVIERNAQGEPARLAGVHIDVSAAHQVQTELAEAKDAAIRASQAKSNFLATMSHEIRTPMNAIIGLTHLMIKTEMTPRQRDYAGKVQTASKNLLDIINDILDFSKIEAGKLIIEKIDFDIDDLIADASTVIAPRFHEKGLEFVVSRAPEVPRHLVGDPLRLSQVIINLLSNSAKFTKRGGVTLAIGGYPAGVSQFMLEITVTDTGIGMSDDQVAALFKPFAQADASTSRRYGGTGLGLAICRQLASLLGGRIDVRSTLGEGSTFSLGIPTGVADPRNVTARAFASASRRADTKRRAADVVLPNAKVLLVEDNAINQQVAIELLEGLGIQVTVAESGEAAVALLRTQPFDLALMDIQMPGMDGFTATAMIRSELNLTAMPILAMTANAMAGDRARCLEAGMNDHIAKPIDPDTLALTLSHWFDHIERFRNIHGTSATAAPPPLESAMSLPGIDINLALRNLNGNRALLIRLLRELALEYFNRSVIPRDAVENRDWRALHASAHKLKGAAATLGAVAVAKIAGELEVLTAIDKVVLPQTIERLVEALSAALDEVASGVVSILPRDDVAPALAITRPNPSAAKLMPVMDELARLLAEGNADAEQASGQLAALLAGTDAGTRAENVASLAGRFDFADAMAALNALRSDLSNGD